MNKRIKIILVIFSILILLGIKDTFAGTGNFSINKSKETLEIGKTTTFSITATNCGGRFIITSSNSNVASVSSADEWIENSSKEITITAKAAGTTTITIKADNVATTDAEPEEVTGAKIITITVPEKNNNSNTETTGNSTPTPEQPKKSSEARLSNLGIKPNDFTGFKKDKYEYSTEVPNDVSEVEIYANVIKDSNATLKGTGKVSLKEGNNTFEIKVTAEDGKTTKTYKLTIKRRTASEEEVKTSEARLSNLGIKPEEYDFKGFKKDQYEYAVEIPNETKEIEVYATAVDSKAQITGLGMVELKEGLNTIKVEVIAQNGNKKTYTIKATRKEAEKKETPVETIDKKEKFGLSSLAITGLTLNPKFNVSTYEYKIDLKENLNTLEIITKTTDKDATVEIVGNENFQDGENVITILVNNEDTKENATYQIIVDKQVELEIVEKTSWLKPSTWGKEEIIKISIIVVLIILIVIAIVLKVQIAKDEQKDKKVDLPGAEALDKALAEHQELATEEQENEETKGEVKKFLEDFPQEEQEVNENLKIDKENTRVSVDDLFKNDDFNITTKKRGKGKHF